MTDSSSTKTFADLHTRTVTGLVLASVFLALLAGAFLSPAFVSVLRVVAFLAVGWCAVEFTRLSKKLHRNRVRTICYLLVVLLPAATVYYTGNLMYGIVAGMYISLGLAFTSTRYSLEGAKSALVDLF